VGFPYPHYDAEFLAGVVGIALVAMIAFPVARGLPKAAGIPLAVLPLLLLFGWTAWTWHRARRN